MASGTSGAGQRIANGARDCGMLADGSAEAEVVGVSELAVVFDLLAFEADVGDPVLAATVGAAGDVKAELLIELGQALLELVDEPAGEAFGFGDGELAEFGAGAGDGAAPERGAVDVEADLAEFAGQFAGASELGMLRKSRFCMTVARRLPLP